MVSGFSALPRKARNRYGKTLLKFSFSKLHESSQLSTCWRMCTYLKLSRIVDRHLAVPSKGETALRRVLPAED